MGSFVTYIEVGRSDKHKKEGRGGRGNGLGTQQNAKKGAEE